MNMKEKLINICGGIDAEQIANEADKNKYYGKKVTGYIPQNNSTVEWKIFYADNNNIYLIADNYIEINEIPEATNLLGKRTGNKPTTGDKERAAYFGKKLRNDYETGTERILDIVKPLNKSYFIDNAFKSKNENIKVTAYMLDTIAWSDFKDNTGKAKFVIGGPTIEMVLDSYSQKHNVKYKAKAVSDSSINNTGYQISMDDGKNWSNWYGNWMLNDNGNYDSLYVITDTQNAEAMWVASPSAAYNMHIMRVNFNRGCTRYRL